MLNNVRRMFKPVTESALNSTNSFKEKKNEKDCRNYLCMYADFCLSACSGPNYVMHTNDGRSIVTDGKPQTDNDTGMISYKDANGNKQQINRTDVKEMVALEN